MRVMQAPPEEKTGEDGLPVPPYAIYNIGNNHPENLLGYSAAGTDPGGRFAGGL